MIESLLNLANPRIMDGLIAKLRQLGQMRGNAVFRVKIVKFRRNRSDAQNRYYWSVVVPHIAAGIKEAWGETLDKDETHDYLKRKFLGRTICDRSTGEAKGRIVKSSAKLNTKEFCEYVDRVCAFAAQDLGVFVPEPDSEYMEVRACVINQPQLAA